MGTQGTQQIHIRTQTLDAYLVGGDLGAPTPIALTNSFVSAFLQGEVLASCSSDGAVKVWNMCSTKCIHDFREHTREVCSLAWSPVVPESEDKAGGLPLLASGSLDTTIKIWNLKQGKCIRTISKHVHPVIALAFSPTGTILLVMHTVRPIFSTCEFGVLDAGATFHLKLCLPFLRPRNRRVLSQRFTRSSSCLVRQ